MNAHHRQRWHAVSGLVVIAFGIAGASFERGSPPMTASIDQTVAFLTTYRSELLAQSLMFVMCAGAWLWFYAVLRTELRRDGNAVATAASVAFGAGVVSASLQLMLQAVQAASVLAAHPQMDASAARFFSGMMWSISVIAYVPVAVMLAAVAIASWQHTIFPAWLTWWSAAASLAHLIMSAGLVAGSGPLVPGGTLTYALYAMLMIWLIAITTVMARRPASVPVL